MAASHDHPLALREARSRQRARGDALQADGDGVPEDLPSRRQVHDTAKALEQPDPACSSSAM